MLTAEPPHAVPLNRPVAKQPKRTTKFRNTVLWLGVVAITGSVAWHALRPAPAAVAPAPPPPKVTVAPVEERVLTEQHELLGRVDAVESVEIRPRVSGHIDEVRLRAGEVVKKGDVLFTIDPRPYRAQSDLATAALERAKARALNTARLARRAADLFKSHAVSIEESETAAANDAEAQADVLAAEATLATARLDLEFTEVRAPIDGRVNRAYITAGNLVSGAPGSATLLTTLVSVGDVYVYADVDEATLLAFNRLQRDGTLAKESGHVAVDMQLSDETAFGHRGYIESADNRLQSGTGSLVLRMVFPNAEGDLIPGLFARVRLPVSAPETALLVSERAIGTDQSQKFVLTVGADNVAAYRTVKLGPLLEGRRVVREGLHRGERVIVNGLQRTRPGSLVSPENLPAQALAAAR